MEVIFLTMRRNGRTFKTRLNFAPCVIDRALLDGFVAAFDLDSMEVLYVDGNSFKTLVINR